ncbi:MAG: T9SS type A sorting domain-containing protein [Bacteroidales bacterium]
MVEELPPSYDDVNVVMAQNNGLIESSIEYSDSSLQWLGGVQDFDIPNNSFNWIRSGTKSFNDGSPDDDWRTRLETYDPEENYEKIVGGTWAPYFMFLWRSGSKWRPAPVYSFGGSALSKELNPGLSALASVDIVLTPDKSKWTRCPVLEMCNEQVLAEGNAKRFDLRKAPSVDKDGNPSGWPGQKDASLNPDDPNYIMSHGMGWFPGYAINLETGERMNMMFGEDSWLGGDNGRDMLFNPSPNFTSFPTGSILFGGKHYVYILASGEFEKITVNDTISYKFPAYDTGYSIAYAIDTIPAGFEGVYKPIILSSPMYVGIPLSVPDVPWLANEAKIRIRIAKPYEKYYAKPADIVTENYNYPMYQFSTENLATTTYSQSKAERDLDLINVVPNPYYAYSSYELVPLENKVKVTNLPEKCVVSIYNVSGNLIRKFTKDDPVTYIDWDLKNHAGIPIAGGVYLVHVKDQTTGQERIIKWFGSLRIEDFNEF